MSVDKELFSYEDLQDFGERRSKSHLVWLGNQEPPKYPRGFLLSSKVRVWWGHEIRDHYRKLSAEGLANQEERRLITKKAAAKSVEVRRRMGLLPPLPEPVK